MFRSVQHEEALANLIYGLQSRKGFVVRTGEVGTGKTTMLECLRDFLSSQQITYASLFNSRLNVQQFFEVIAYDFGLRCTRTSKSCGTVRAHLAHVAPGRRVPSRTTRLAARRGELAPPADSQRPRLCGLRSYRAPP